MILPLHLSVLVYLFYQLVAISTERVTYMNLQRPEVEYFNTSYAKSVTFKSRRRSNDRKDPRYYTHLYVETLIPIDNNLKIDIYFYELLTNKYSPTFVKVHYGFCDLMEKDMFFGQAFKRFTLLLNITCPIPPGVYNVTDITIERIPKHFPFTRGRIYFNLTKIVKKISTLAGLAHIDMELKDMVVPKNKSK